MLLSRLKILLFLASGAALASPALAGHGTIRETDTEIIIEYYGDDADVKKAAEIRAERMKHEEDKKIEIEKKDLLNQRRALRKAKNTNDSDE